MLFSLLSFYHSLSFFSHYVFLFLLVLGLISFSLYLLLFSSSFVSLLFSFLTLLFSFVFQFSPPFSYSLYLCFDYLFTLCLTYTSWPGQRVPTVTAIGERKIPDQNDLEGSYRGLTTYYPRICMKGLRKPR
jgi:hypothetical protein